MMIEEIFWRVPGEPARWWSCEAAAYVDVLPNGAREAPVESEATLRRMLLDNGLPAPGGPRPSQISKDAIWRRASQTEVDAMDTEMRSQPVVVQRIYEGATHIESDDALFALLVVTMEQLFGEEKAARLLAPNS